MVKISITLVCVYIIVWVGVLGLPLTDLPKNKSDLWVSYLIVVEEVLSLICIVVIGKIILMDLKSSLKAS
ncbi:transporter suffix domain-containing protein [Vibrio kyushuensis]|uniref:transporter suffix domain-containing protein n=1 Tax=Vibrio TaxID=662 RepID=UPI003D1172BC